MLLEIALAGYASHWAFRGSRTFNAWAEAKPWLREGGLCVVRTESAEVGDLVIPSIRRAVHGSNGGESRLDIRRLEVGGRAGTPTQSLLREFELDPTISPFEARDRIRTCLLDRSFLLVFVEAAPVDSNDWEEIVSLLEYYRKSTNPVRLCAVVVDGRLSPGASREFIANLLRIVQTKNITPVAAADAATISLVREGLITGGRSQEVVTQMSDADALATWVNDARVHGVDLLGRIRTAEQMAHSEPGTIDPLEVPRATPPPDRSIRPDARHGVLPIRRAW